MLANNLQGIIIDINKFACFHMFIHLSSTQHLFNTQMLERYGLLIKTHDSESRGQEETAIIREIKNTRPLSELFTRKSVKKLTNALVKPP